MQVYEPELPIDDLKASLYRRGPDNLGCRKVLLHPHCMSSVANGGNGFFSDLCKVDLVFVFDLLCSIGMNIFSQF